MRVNEEVGCAAQISTAEHRRYARIGRDVPNVFVCTNEIE